MNDTKSALFVHLLHDHDVLLTTTEYQDLTFDEMRALDPCEVTE